MRLFSPCAKMWVLLMGWDEGSLGGKANTAKAEHEEEFRCCLPPQADVPPRPGERGHHTTGVPPLPASPLLLPLPLLLPRAHSVAQQSWGPSASLSTPACSLVGRARSRKDWAPGKHTQQQLRHPPAISSFHHKSKAERHRSY